MKACSKCKNEKTGSHISYCKECYRQYKKEWYKKNRQREIKRCSDYNKKNPEVPRRSMQKCRKNNPEKYKEYYKNYRKQNPEKVLIWDTRKKIKRNHQKSISTGFTEKEWAQIKKNYNYCCAYCGTFTEKLQMDHVKPLCKGGNHEKENIVPACAFCNNSKNGKDLKEWLDWREKNERI